MVTFSAAPLIKRWCLHSCDLNWNGLVSLITKSGRSGNVWHSVKRTHSFHSCSCGTLKPPCCDERSHGGRGLILSGRPQSSYPIQPQPSSRIESPSENSRPITQSVYRIVANNYFVLGHLSKWIVSTVAVNGTCPLLAQKILHPTKHLSPGWSPTNNLHRDKNVQPIQWNIFFLVSIL